MGLGCPRRTSDAAATPQACRLWRSVYRRPPAAPRRRPGGERTSPGLGQRCASGRTFGAARRWPALRSTQTAAAANTLSAAALYRKPPRRPCSTHRTMYRSIGRTRSSASDARQRESHPAPRSSASTSLNPRRCWCGFGRPSRRHRIWRCSVRPERRSGARRLPSARARGPSADMALLLKRPQYEYILLHAGALQCIEWPESLAVWRYPVCSQRTVYLLSPLCA